MHPIVRDGLTALGIAAGYLACVFIGAMLSVPAEGFAIIWPARAFLIAILVLLPVRRWWPIAAVIPTHFLMAAVFLPETSPGLVATQVLGHLSVALATAFVIRKVNPVVAPFDGLPAVFKFILLAGLVVPGVIDGAILAGHVAVGWSDENLWLTWHRWIVAGFFPTITIPPLLVLAVRGNFTGRPQPSPMLKGEIGLVIPALFVVSLLAFGGFLDAANWPAVYVLPIPLLLWVTARFGVGGTSLALLVMAAGISIQALRQLGPFASPSLVEELVSLQSYLAATSVPLLLFAALMDERRRTANLLRQFEAGMQVATSQTDTGLWLWDAKMPRLWVTDNCRAMFDLPDEDTNTPYDFLEAVHPEDKAVVGEALRGALTNGAQLPVLEFRLISGGKTCWFVLQTRTSCNEAGRPLSVSGVFRDISDRIESRLAVERLEERLATLQDDERRRIAQELHDSTAQHLVGAQLNLLNLRKQVAEEQQVLVDEAYRSLREATAEIRTFTYLLHASQVDEEGLGTMLRRYVPGFERRTGLRTTLRVCPRADELPGELQHALLRITQESLGNVQRHAGAKQASVDLRCFADSLHLVVRDDGKGIGPGEGDRLAERLRLGLGLPGMTVRVRALAGRTGRTGRGLGTTIHVSVPVEDAIPSGARGIANIARETLGAGRG